MSTYKQLVPLLYKYLPPERADVLERCRIRFTQVAAFNDPFEARPFVKGVASDEAVSKIFRDRLQEIWEQRYKSPKLSSEIVDALGQILHRREAEFSEELFRLIYNEINRELGVLSLTEHRDNLLMWAHYASSHEGFVVGFNQNDLWLSSELNEPSEIRKVHYSTERPATSPSRLSRLEWFFVKGNDWSYEDEWRAIRPLSEAVERVPGSPFDICLFEFPSRCVREVIFGSRSRAATRQRLLAALRSGTYSDVRLLQATIDEQEYRLVFSSVRDQSDGGEREL